MGFYTRVFSAHPTTRELVQTRWLLRKGAVIIYQHEGLHYFRAIWKKWRPPPIEWRKKWPPPLLRNAEKMTSPCAKREKWFVALICIFGTFQRKKMVTPHIEWEKKIMNPPPLLEEEKNHDHVPVFIFSSSSFFLHVHHLFQSLSMYRGRQYKVTTR